MLEHSSEYTPCRTGLEINAPALPNIIEKHAQGQFGSDFYSSVAGFRQRLTKSGQHRPSMDQVQFGPALGQLWTNLAKSLPDFANAGDRR